MAFEIGTAAGHKDLLDKITLFLTTKLGAANYALLIDEDKGASPGDNIAYRYRMFKAPGLSGTDEIFFGFVNYQSVVSDYYNAWINGYTGYVPGNGMENQPGGIYGTNAAGLGIPLWNQEIKYWLVANGDGFVCAVKVQNAYYTFGAGFFLKYGTFKQYPYPLVVHAVTAPAGADRYSGGHVNGWKGNRPNLRMRFLEGSWRTPNTLPYCAGRDTANNYDSGVPITIRNTNSDSNVADGYYGLHPIELFSAVGTGDFYGVLPHLYFVSGFNNAVENTLTHNGITYVVLRDNVSTGLHDYVALRLE